MTTFQDLSEVDETAANKLYQAIFYQKTAAYDSLEKQVMNEADIKKIGELGTNQIDELAKCINRKVWINIGELSGGYYIWIFYDNVYNEANGVFNSKGRGQL